MDVVNNSNYILPMEVKTIPMISMIFDDNNDIT